MSEQPETVPDMTDAEVDAAQLPASIRNDHAHLRPGYCYVCGAMTNDVSGAFNANPTA